ncbi:ABC transporter substrate-binding protein [Billgrantia endophytica]|uniref:ABC transporter substrate-binding protein n=1 Tax=Billgrantia endophytica TaxID=2033802 RepID=A0A2N7UEJ7_9GAMM|nr:ABC transporter substrate-binding protein [Halomonas endophytica]PMR78811.1 ABC transporter substrate-binding protein [Halomonas endophytica]
MLFSLIRCTRHGVAFSPWCRIPDGVSRPLPSSVRRSRRWSTLAVAWIGLTLTFTAQQAMAREVTDMLGRTVQVPERIERVLGVAPPITALLYALSPRHVIGLNLPFQPGDEHFVDPHLTELPLVGAMLGHGRRLQAETVLELRPDVAISWGGSVPQASVDETIRLFERAGVPVLFVNIDTLADWPAAFEFVGSLIGYEARAGELAAEVNRALDTVSAAVGDIPEAQRKRVYYAQGMDGLATECHTSFHVEPIELAGGYNVHRCQQSSYVGMELVSLEQVLAYDPEVMVVQEPGFFARLNGADGPGAWRNVRAVRDGNVLLVPRRPLNWLDRPPSFMRALGIRWLASELYPERMSFDERGAPRDFYTRFFGVTPSDAALDAVLAVEPAAEPSGHHHHAAEPSGHHRH